MTREATGQPNEPASSYLICSLPRSGSWLLAEGLRQTGLLGNPEEYFWSDLRELYTRQWQLPSEVDDETFISCARRAGTTENGVFGAKVHWFQFGQLVAMLRGREPDDTPVRGNGNRRRRQADHELLMGYLPNVRYVHLTRVDKIAQAISWHRALQTRVWWDIGRGDAQPPPEARFEADAIEQLEHRLRADEWQWVSYFADVGAKPIVVTYESLSCDYAGTLRRLVEELGVSADKLDIPKPQLRQQADHDSETWRATYVERRSRRVRKRHRSRPPVSVIIVSHNEGENLRRTVDGMSASVPDTVEIVVVDDHSTDGSAAFLAENDRVRLVSPPERGGVAGARNFGGSVATGDLLVFSDAHVDVSPGWLPPLCDALDDSSVAAVTPAISSAARRGDKGYGFTWGDPTLKMHWYTRQPPSPTPIPFICGCFMMFRRTDFELVGGFDPGMVTWGSEDAEICLNLWRRGRASLVVPDSHIVHLFRPTFPYQVGWQKAVHNTLRLATVHLGPQAVRRIVRHFCGWREFAPAYADLLDSDVWQRRDEVQSASKHDDLWFFDRFRIAALT